MGQAAGLSNGVNNARMAVNVPGGNSNDDTAQSVLFYRRNVLKMSPNDFSNLLLIA